MGGVLVGRLRRRFRQKRYNRIETRFPEAFERGWALDLGGGPASFFAAWFPDNARVVLLDIDWREVARAAAKIPGLRAVVGDGMHLPFPRGAMSLIVSNSVIEHVADPVALANEIRRVGRSYFVQTPHGGFPVETHSYVGIPFYRLLRPRGLRRLACRLFGANFDYLESVHYLTEHQLRQLFPDADLEREAALGLTKSFFVVGGGGSR